MWAHLVGFLVARNSMSAGSALLDARLILEALDVLPGMHVADLGAGRTGHFAFRAGELVGEDGRVYAVDVLPAVVEMLHGARALRGATNVHAVWGNMERVGGVPLADQSLDVALLVHALSSLREWETAVCEAKRLLKPKGRLVVVDWHPEADHPVARQSLRPLAAREADALFGGLGCRKCAEFVPSRWHWGRVYAS